MKTDEVSRGGTDIEFVITQFAKSSLWSYNYWMTKFIKAIYISGLMFMKMRSGFQMNTWAQALFMAELIFKSETYLISMKNNQEYLLFTIICILHLQSAI